MSNEPKKKKNYLFQRFICVARPMMEPELKTMNPREGETEPTPYCTFLASTGSAYGTSDDAIFSVMLKGKQAEAFCKEPRKGETFLFDLQLRTYNKTAQPGQKFGERMTSFVGSFSFLGNRREDKQGATPEVTEAQPELKVEANKDKEDVPF